MGEPRTLGELEAWLDTYPNADDPENVPAVSQAAKMVRMAVRSELRRVIHGTDEAPGLVERVAFDSMDVGRKPHRTPNDVFNALAAEIATEEREG